MSPVLKSADAEYPRRMVWFGKRPEVVRIRAQHSSWTIDLRTRVRCGAPHESSGRFRRLPWRFLRVCVERSVRRELGGVSDGVLITPRRK